VGRPLWREDRSAICSVITQWSESLRIRNHTLLSHLRLPQPGGPGSRIYIPRKRMAQLYSRALGSLYVASYVSQGIWEYSKPKSKLLYDCQSLCLGVEYPCGTCDQILLPVGMLLSEICSLVSVGCPLWREDMSAICSVITQWPESLKTRNHTLLSHLRLPQPGGPGSSLYIPQEKDGPVIPPGTGFRGGHYFLSNI
jgi:hypothetical protein